MNSTQRLAIPLACIALLAAVLVSCFSGYIAMPIPAEIKWQISPLGLLFDFNREFLDLETFSSFAGKLGLHFDYFWVFLKTCILEAPFYYLVLRKQRVEFFVSALLVGNLLTHPAIYFFFPWLIKNFLAYALSAEVFAPLVEAGFVLMILRGTELKPAAWKTAALITLANLFSWQMGAWV